MTESNLEKDLCFYLEAVKKEGMKLNRFFVL